MIRGRRVALAGAGAVRPAHGLRRALGGFGLALAAPALVCALAPITSLEGKPGPAALFLLTVLFATRVGGLLPGLLAAGASFAGLGYFFVEPLHSFALNETSVASLLAFVFAALVMSTVVVGERRALDEARTSQAQLSLAFQLGELGAWQLEPLTGSLWLSPESERLLGLPEGSFDGRLESVLRLVHRDEVERANDAFDRMLEGDSEVTAEARVVRPDGVERWVEIRGGAIPSLHERRRIVGVLSDVTERMRREAVREEHIAELTREHSLLRSVIDQMPIGVVIAEAPSGAMLIGNPQVEKIWRQPLGEVAEFDGYERYSKLFHEDGRLYTPEESPLLRSIAQGEVVVGERLGFERGDGTRGVLEASSAPIRDTAGSIVAGVVAFADVTARIAHERRQRFLGEASTELASSLDYQQTLSRVAALAIPDIADWCSIELQMDGEIRNVAVHHEEPSKVELVRRLREEYPGDPDGQTGVPVVIRTGRSEFFPEIPDELLVAVARDERHLEILRELGMSSAIIAPLTARGETIGALTLIGEGDRRFDGDDLAFAEEIARRAAIAVDNARLHVTRAEALDDAHEARARTARLQAVTDALSETMTSADVAQVLVREGLVALRAQAAAVFALSSDRLTFTTLGSAGYGDRLARDWPSFAADTPGPSADAIRTREPVAIESLAELRERWPDLAEAATNSAMLTAPLLVGDDPIGVLHMAFRKPRTFDETDISFLQTLARQCAQALERSRLYEQEQVAREQAERLAARLRRLQTVVDATFTSGSLDELLHELLVRLQEAVGSDTAAILILDEDDELLVMRESIGFDGPIETKVPLGQGFAGRVAATRTHWVIPDLSEIEVVGTFLQQAEIASIAGVPLIAEGRLVGVVHVGSRERREFDREEVLLLRLVAGRAAVAIDRARVHEHDRGIAELLQRSLLPDRLPAVEGVGVAARYIPGTVGVAVGGDWYDVFELPDGSIGIAVGDVVGHGVRAAATMGRLRSVLRAYALEGFGPAEALGRLNRLACQGDEETFATVVCALVAPSRTRLRIASAGHPPILLRGPDGEVRLIEEGRGLPIGATADASYAEAELRIDPGSTLVLYTDGLVERHGESIDMGIARLQALVGASRGRPLDELADRVVEQLESDDHADDVALLAIHLEPQVLPTLSLRFPAEPRALAPLRASLRSWLEGHGVRDDEIFDILVAVNEACSNAVEHPLGGAGPEVTLDAELVDGEVSLVVRDRGRWRPAGPPGDRGRGIEFMGALMEHVDVRHDDSGTTVEMRRKLHRGTA